MATPTTTELFAAWPELTTAVADELTTLGSILTHTTDIVGETAFATQEKVLRARLLLAAHCAVLVIHRSQKHGGDGIGAVTGRTMQDGSTVSYSQVQGYTAEGTILTTRYGVMYAEMGRGNPRRLPRVSGMRRC